MTEGDGGWLLAGRYRVKGIVGRGGMSEVFYGHDERLDRAVAIKFLKLGDVVVADSPENAAIVDQLKADRVRFVREVRTMASIEHPGIPAVFDTDQEQDGLRRQWIVMPLLRGATLASLLETDFAETLPSIAWVAAVGAQAAAALDCVHTADVVHRDIKPANVMVLDDGTVKVLDFGIALARGAGAMPRLTQIDRTVGTAPYMSPEQFNWEPVTPASDIYSLGCVLLETITGDPPFPLIEGSQQSLRAQHHGSARPSAASRRPDVPREVDQLITSMMSVDPQQRPTARQVYDALRQWAATGTATDGYRDPTRQFHSPLLTLPAPTRSRQPSDALSPVEFESLQSAVGELFREGHFQQAIDLLEGTLAERKADAVDVVIIRHTLGTALHFAGRYRAAVSHLDYVAQQVRRHQQEDYFSLDCAFLIGSAYAALGEPTKALPHLVFYLHNATDEFDTQAHERRREAEYLVAAMHEAEGRTDEAIDEYRQLRGRVAEELGADAVQVASIDRRIAHLNSRNGAKEV
ncbi:protein kinase domain-containing protein [Nocardia sp. CA-128927]|uniref:serine/threonine-protein kinase n=1 Tax=Nocardia sp. CA-128927 TaxID=3239975 RepID=UPI003D977C4A